MAKTAAKTDEKKPKPPVATEFVIVPRHFEWWTVYDSWKTMLSDAHAGARGMRFSDTAPPLFNPTVGHHAGGELATQWPDWASISVVRNVDGKPYLYSQNW